MKSVSFRRPLAGSQRSFEDYVMNCLKEIESASLEDAIYVADDMTVSNFTTSRTLNAGTATTTQLANFVATFIDDLQRRGKNRTQ